MLIHSTTNRPLQRFGRTIFLAWLLCWSNSVSGQAIVARVLPTNFSSQSGTVPSQGTFDDAATVEFWTFTAPVGQRLTLEVDRVEQDFDPFVWIFAGAITNRSHFLAGQVQAIDNQDQGFVAAVDSGVGPLGFYGTFDPRVAIDLPPTATTFTVMVASFRSGSEAGGSFSLQDGGDGLYSYNLRARLSPILAPAVVGRAIFYNNSFFDGNNVAPTVSDDLAIATDKLAYRRGSGQATFANYTNYSRGINGIIIDLVSLPGTPTADDLEFRVGNNNSPTSWSGIPAFSVSTVTLRRGVGIQGSDRLTVVFADNTIRNQWLQVKVLATPRTGLASEDVHYWGHQAGEVGNETGLTRVNTADTSRIAANFTGFVSANVENRFDLNRDARVNTQDYSYSQSTYTGFTSLVLLNIP